MGKALLDTDIFSEVLKGVDPTVAARKTAYLAAFGHYTVSLVTVAEWGRLHRGDQLRHPCT
jgi:tRNA(fMet)-specific endonuclease VapC